MPGCHHLVIISNLDSMLQLRLKLRSFSAIDAQLGDEGKGDHAVGASDRFLFSVLSLQGMKRGMESNEVKNLMTNPRGN